jgi:hypothetical protein
MASTIFELLRSYGCYLGAEMSLAEAELAQCELFVRIIPYLLHHNAFSLIPFYTFSVFWRDPLTITQMQTAGAAGRADVPSLTQVGRHPVSLYYLYMQARGLTCYFTRRVCFFFFLLATRASIIINLQVRQEWKAGILQSSLDMCLR